MQPTKAYAAYDSHAPLAPFQFERRIPREHDVQIEILYCGVCHSDIHQVRNEWGGAKYPMVPGHEIVGRVVKVGTQVRKFKVGELAGVGCIVDSCRTCNSCIEKNEQYCENHFVGTYNSLEKDDITITQGGYSDKIVVGENYVLKVSEKLPLANVAPLLCAGITTYSPIKQWQIGKGHKVAILGLGGLGHVAVKIAASKGAEVTVLSTSESKQKDAERLGALHFIVTKNSSEVRSARNTFDFIIDTVSAPHDINFYTALLKTDGTLIMLGIPPETPQLKVSNLINKRRRIAGSLIGGIAETQEMLDYCAQHNIVADVEVIPISYINEAYERMIKGDVHYRFVIDMNSLE